MQQATTVLRILSLCTGLVAAPAVAQEVPVLFVDADATGANDGSSWVNAYADLQDALATARNNPDIAEIWVAAGTYKPTPADEPGPPPAPDRWASFELVEGVGLYGGFAGWETQRGQRDPDYAANVTTLSGDLNGDDESDPQSHDDNSYHVVWAVGGESSTVIDGFAIMGGFTASTDMDGGGMYVSGDITIAHCTITGNFAWRYGGGIYIAGSSPTVIGCTFSRNNAAAYGSGIGNEGGSPSVSNCTFVDNQGGAAMHNEQGSPVITGCTFTDNRGGGVHNGSGAPMLVDCVFVANWRWGMTNDSGGEPVLIDCTFTEHHDSSYARGGGMSNRGSPTLIGCSFARNAGHGIRL